MRQLARWLPERAEAPRQDVAERLGQWLKVNEAIQLHTAQGAMTAAGVAAARRATGSGLRADVLPAVRQALQQEWQQVRAVLTQSITARDLSHRPDPNDPDTEFALAVQRLHDQQRRMELSIEALRAHVRQAMAQTTPDMARLAALDAAMDPLLAAREQRLLSALPALLKVRFVALRQAAMAPADTHPDRADGRWLHTFAAECEQLQLAELELRLLPLTGLIESLDA